jgi:ribosome modulation factor
MQSKENQMGRTRGSRNRPKDDAADSAKPNNAPLTDEQQQALFFEHQKAYKAALEKKKAADAAFKNQCKLIKSEGTSVKDIKAAIDLESEGGEERLREEIERKHRIARWLGLPVGTQPSFFDEADRTPSIDKAMADGKRAGLKGESATPPKHYGGQQQGAWMEGWHEGQAVLMNRMGQKHDEQRAQDAADFDKPGEAA